MACSTIHFSDYDRGGHGVTNIFRLSSFYVQEYRVSSCTHLAFLHTYRVQMHYVTYFVPEHNRSWEQAASLGR
jgi:hypothetical protein